MIVVFAIGASVALEKVARAQFLGTVIAGEVLGVPGFPERRDDLADDGLIAGVTAALLRRIDTLPRHIRLQVPKHTIQLILVGSLVRFRVG